MVTDLGGFAAATFKRGISYINIPTLCSLWWTHQWGVKQESTSTELKNEIGAFAPANSVFD